MQTIYKYLPEKYVDNFIKNGAILFRSLSYFRDYEDAQVRGDEFEGTRIHRPQNGLEITLAETQQKIMLPHTFESAANEDDIFIFCLSTIFSSELAAQFNATACIEITTPGRFIGGIKAAIQRRPSIKDKTLVHGKVNYYEKHDPSPIEWALPDKIAMSKLSTYSGQHEFRIAFAVNDAFRVENTKLRLVTPGERRHPRATLHPERILKLGNISKLCKVHHF